MAVKYYSIRYMEAAVGTADVTDLARDSLRFQRPYGSGNSGWKTAATGNMDCIANNGGKPAVNWRLTSINRNV